MSRYVVIDNRSEVLVPALQLGDSQNNAWTSLDMQATAPTGDGVYTSGHLGVFSAQKLFVQPYCMGLTGSRFSLRLYGWRGAENNAGAARSGANSQVWLPYLLAELACVACARQGPPGAQRIVQASENMCDTITLTRGALGAAGEIVSNPGTGLIAFAQVELRGAKFFSFDFKTTDPVPMNALFARG